MAKALLLFSVLSAIAVGTIWALVRLLGLQGSLVWTATAGGIAWLIKLAVEQERDRRRLLAAEKREQYLRFMDFMNETLPLGDDTAAPMSSDKIRELRRWSLHLNLIGSDQVVRTWNTVRLSGDSKQGAELLRSHGRLWLEMRRDCGHHGTKLSVSDVLTSIVNDVEEYREQLDRPDSPQVG